MRADQLGMSWDGFIFGGWQGYPYVWEFEKRGVPLCGRTVRTGGGRDGCFRVGRTRTQIVCFFLADNVTFDGKRQSAPTVVHQSQETSCRICLV